MKTVAAAVIRNGERILIGRRRAGSKLAGKWEFPGGKVEPGETLEECLRRELREELGITARIGERLCSSEFAYEHGTFRIEALWVDILCGQPALNDHDRLEWVPVQALKTYDLVPADLPIADAIAAGFASLGARENSRPDQPDAAT